MPASLARAAHQDLHDAGAQADQDPDLPGTVIGPGCIKDQPAAPGARRRSNLIIVWPRASSIGKADQLCGALRPHSPRG